MKRLAPVLLLLVLLLLAAPREAAAYIDPGTGSLLLQGLIAGLAAAAVAIRAYWYRLKAFFRGDKPEPKPEATPAPKQPGEPE